MTMMKTTLAFHLAAAGLFALGADVAAAQSFRCKNDLVNVGDSRASVLLKCGEPVVKDTFCRAIEPPPGSPSTGNVLPCENVDEWTFNPGYGQFITTLRFREGTLVSIKYGDRAK